MSNATREDCKFLDIYGEVIAPPSKEDIADLRSYNLGSAMRFAEKLGRPLTDWEFEIFKKIPNGKVYEVVELGNGRFGIDAQE
ncbi:MAG: hypothetical protein LBG97_00115 [Coriobacteriales bacterium]|jgi:hypothetical protein|nr:hypothetical protein [Coriobacteriales bacterium]